MTAFRRSFRSLLARLLGGRKSWSTARPRPNAQPDFKKIAALFLSNVVNDETVAEYQKIAGAVKDFARPYFLLHVRPDTPFDARLEPAVYPFTDEILNTMGYEPWAKSFVPGSAHFPLLHFFLEQNQHEHYWIIEYDVRFSGDWRCFFESFRDVEADFLTSCIRVPPDEPDWCWWNSLRHPESFIPLEQRLASFNPIYRISNPALKYLYESHRGGWVGHFEVFDSDFAPPPRFKLVDFGGEGAFVRAGERTNFTSPEPEGTFRHRPFHLKAGPLVNKLYHPVKKI